MRFNLKKKYKENTRAVKELIVILILSVFIFLFAASFDAFEVLVVWTREYEEFELDELFVLLKILSFAFATFSILRWKELAGEIAKRKQANSALVEAQVELEFRIEERTLDLSRSNISLEQEITERKQVEQALRKSEYDYRTLFDNTIDGLLVIDGETMRPLLANQAIREIFGVDFSTDVIDVNPLDFITPDDRKQASRIVIKDLFKKDLRRIEELRANRTDGSEIWISTVGTRIEYQGRLVGLVSVRDITESKMIEAQLRQSQKMEGIGQLAGGIAHDFNNILAVIQGNTELAMMGTSETDPLYIKLKRIRDFSRHAADLTSQLLIFSRKQSMVITTLNVNAMIDDFFKMLFRLLGENITMKTELEPDLWAIRADAGNMEQLIMNLTVNARDAMQRGGRLTIVTENIVLNKVTSRLLLGARPGKFIRLSVEDTGSGMDIDTIEHMFEPFFTTKEIGKGTGLGLSVVYGIVKEHKGWINVYSSLGSGTAFKVYLPAFFGAMVEEAEEEMSVKDMQGNGERILLVEDEEKVREMAAAALTSNGYVVVEAQDVKQAIDILGKEEAFRLVFSDVVLPDDSGLVLAEHVLSHHAEVKILMASGYLNNKAQTNAIREKGIPFLKKPYSLPDLFKTIKNILKST